MLHAQARATPDIVDSQIRAKAKALCVEDGFDPD